MGSSYWVNNLNRSRVMLSVYSAVMTCIIACTYFNVGDWAIPILVLCGMVDLFRWNMKGIK